MGAMLKQTGEHSSACGTTVVSTVSSSAPPNTIFRLLNRQGARTGAEFSITSSLVERRLGTTFELGRSKLGRSKLGTVGLWRSSGLSRHS
jgi:hypothetical protein